MKVPTIIEKCDGVYVATPFDSYEAARKYADKIWSTTPRIMRVGVIRYGNPATWGVRWTICSDEFARKYHVPDKLNDAQEDKI